MKNLKKVMLSMLLFFAISTAFSQTKITGIITDSDMKGPLPAANVTVKGATDGSTTDIDGKFSISTSKTSGEIVINFIGFVSKTISFSGQSGETINLGSISLESEASDLDEVVVVGRGIIDLAKDRKTPIAVSTITSAEIQDKIGTSDITQTLVNTPSVYVTGQAGGFGDSKMSVRGFGQDNTAFLLNGQPINGMEDGLMYWSNWSGMSDIANAIQVQRGLGSSKLAISSVGGTVNFITKATSMREGGFVSAGIANDDYIKTTAAYNTGLMNDKFGVSVMLTHWQGDGYNDGTRGEGQNYFISFGYKASEKHNFNFLITGAPQKHDQNFTKRLSDYQTYGRKYNNNWGTLNGEYKSERTNFYHKPVANLNWDWAISDKSELSTVLYASWGRGGGTGNYGASALRTNGQINFDGIRDRNLAVGDGVQGDTQSYLVRSSMNNHNWYGLVSNFKHQLNENLVFNLGADLRTYYGTHYRQVEDFLGLDSWTESRQLRDANSVPGASVSNTVTESQRARPWPATFNTLGENQRIDYDNSERISYGGIFGQLEYSNDNFSTFFQGSISTQQHQRFDRYDYLPEAEDSEKVNNTGFNAKAGVSYNINENHSFYGNIGYYDRQPYHDNIYLNNTNLINPLTSNEKIFGLEAGYSFKSQYFSANVNAYRTSWKDRVNTTSVTAVEGNQWDLPVGSLIYTTNEGVEQLHTGVEVDIVAKPFTTLDVRGFLSAGNWEYQDEAVATRRDEDRNVLDVRRDDVDGGKVGDAAQFTVGGGLKYRIVERLSVDADYRFYDKLYSRGSAAKNNLELPSYGVLDAGVSYKMLVGADKSKSVYFRFNMNNVLHNIYLSELSTRIKTTDRINPTDATDLRTYESEGRVINGLADANQGFYGLGRTWNFSIRYNF
ncbi:TonB-dependent receptor [Flavobacterium qiangtangense]|uniref:TonB-dependent receptor n=1 Tax=Flavobacterium qiangtangense TaxID=1442595 RepID=A0ABW1PTW5_9FLAO